MGQWIHEHAEQLHGVFGARLPSEATIRRALQRIDVPTLEACMKGEEPPPPTTRWQGRAFDGKAVRGSGTHGQPLHLVSKVCHATGRVLRQHAVADKSNEIPVVQQMLRDRDLRGLLITVDALHTQRRTAALIVTQGGHYLMVVKANQPEMYRALTEWFA